MSSTFDLRDRADERRRKPTDPTKSGTETAVDSLLSPPCSLEGGPMAVLTNSGVRVHRVLLPLNRLFTYIFPVGILSPCFHRHQTSVGLRSHVFIGKSQWEQLQRAFEHLSSLLLKPTCLNLHPFMATGVSDNHNHFPMAQHHSVHTPCAKSLGGGVRGRRVYKEAVRS